MQCSFSVIARFPEELADLLKCVTQPNTQASFKHDYWATLLLLTLINVKNTNVYNFKNVNTFNLVSRSEIKRQEQLVCCNCLYRVMLNGLIY